MMGAMKRRAATRHLTVAPGAYNPVPQGETPLTR